jgi:hypothetical protein
MHTKSDRQVQLEATPADVAGRLKRWAQTARFICTSESPNRWSFHRGSHWKALYTFDIRKIPTDVQIVLTSESPLVAQCEWSMGSLLTFSTPGDAERISEQFDVLVAYLKGAL